MGTETSGPASMLPGARPDDPPDILIHIHPAGERYRADILAAGDYDSVDLGVTPADLEALNVRLRTVVGRLARVGVEAWKANRDQLRGALGPLAEAGYTAFRQIFASVPLLIRERLARPDRLTIAIASDAFFVPWEFLYPLPPAQGLSYDCFWGMKHVLSRVISPDQPGGSVAIEVEEPPHFGLVADAALPAVKDKEVPFFERLAQDGEIALDMLAPLDPARRPASIEVLRDFLAHPHDVTQLDCQGDRQGGLDRLRLANDFYVSTRDLDVHNIVIKKHGLMVVNACETSDVTPRYTLHVARALLRCGARGVVATECGVPDVFAADWSQALNRRLLAGERLGEGLLATRREFLDRHNNPCGLLYAMYAPASIRLQRSGASHPARR